MAPSPSITSNDVSLLPNDSNLIQSADQSLSSASEATSSVLVTCFHSFIDSHILLISLLIIIVIICLVALYNLYRINRIINKLKLKEDYDDDLHGRTVIITGGNDGIGSQIVHKLATKGARLILLCRDVDKARIVSEDVIKKNPTVDINIHHVDLSSMTSIRVCVNEILNLESRIDVLINCASVALIPGNVPTKSIDGYELHMAINYYAHFLLTYLLFDRMKQTAQKFSTIVKVINVSSIIHRCGQIHMPDLNLDKFYTPFKAYSQSKLALVMASREMACQWKATGVHVYSVEPGLAMTDSHYQNLYPFCKKLLSIFGFIIGFRSIDTAADNILHCVLSKKVAKQSGYHYRNQKRCNSGNKQIYDEKLSQVLWTHTMNVCNLQY